MPSRSPLLHALPALAACAWLAGCGVSAPVAIGVPGQACLFGDAPAQIYPNLGPPVSARPKCSGGMPLGLSPSDAWADTEGTSRYACEWTPKSMPGPMPLIVYIHPSTSNADGITNTNFLDGIDTANLSGDPAKPGFILLAPQGRFTYHYYGTNPAPISHPSASDESNDVVNTGWDNWYRQVDPAGAEVVDGVRYEENVDMATIDHFIAEVVATGKVDSNRIYLSGWSNGSAMAYLYALNRPNIAALAVYSSPDPYAAFDDPCEQTPVAGTPRDAGQAHMFAPQVPTYQVHNTCDIAGECPNAQRFMRRIAAEGTPSTEVMIAPGQIQVDPPVCTAVCGTDPNGTTNNNAGLAFHILWPKQWTAAMETFLEQHPLDSR